MKLVEKTCPNCGANLEFNFGDKEVKCKYCNKSYLIEGYDNTNYQNNLNIDLNLVTKTTQSIISIPFIIFIIIFSIITIFIGYTTFKIVSIDHKSISENNETYEENTESLNFLNSITTEMSDKITSKSISTINAWNKTNDNFILDSSKHLGYYLATNGNFSTLYDIFELVYKDENKQYTVYTGVKYSNVKNNEGNINLGNSSIFGSIKQCGFNNLWGYDTVEDLYNNINTPFNETLYAAEGLYNN